MSKYQMLMKKQAAMRLLMKQMMEQANEFRMQYLKSKQMAASFTTENASEYKTKSRAYYVNSLRFMK